MKCSAAILGFIIATGVITIDPPVAAAQSQQQNAAARTLYLAGRDLWDDGKFGDAERKFREALTKYPKAEQSDRTAYYLIETLVKLGRVADARTEIDNFRRNFPQSRWTSDVQEKQIALARAPQLIPIQPNAPAPPINAPGLQVLTRQAEIRSPNGEIRVAQSPAPFGLKKSTNVSLEQEVLRVLLEKDPDRGIEAAKERLKADPSDPAVISNLGVIATTGSPKALALLVSMAGSSASPNARSQAIFWIGRRNGDRDAVAKALIDMLANSKEKETETAVAEALAHFNVAERRAAIDQIAQSQNADKLALLERIYRSSNNVQVRQQIAQSVGQLADARAMGFLVDVAKNDKELAVRRAAIQSLGSRKEPEAIKALEDILKALPAQPRAQ